MKSITLNIGGEERIFYFGLGFLGSLLEKENIQMTEIDEKIAENPFKWIPTMLYHSCAFGYIRKGEFVPFDLFDVSEWIDDIGMDSEVISSFFSAFRNSLVKDVPEEKEVKKKSNEKINWSEDVISFAIGELRMSSLEAVYDMTWAEFQIRLFAYKRQDKYEWLKLRELMWTSYIAPHQDPKKMVKRKEQFLPLNNEKKSTGVSDEMKQTFLKEFRKYQEKIKAE